MTSSYFRFFRPIFIFPCRRRGAALFSLTYQPEKYNNKFSCKIKIYKGQTNHAAQNQFLRRQRLRAGLEMDGRAIGGFHGVFFLRKQIKRIFRAELKGTDKGLILKGNLAVSM